MKDYKVGKETMSDAFCREVYAVVRDIPAGKVISYGEIAALLGKPQCSRMVGRSLKQVPLDLNLPCHRVVNAQGVCFKKSGNVDMARCLWKYDEIR